MDLHSKINKLNKYSRLTCFPFKLTFYNELLKERTAKIEKWSSVGAIFCSQLKEGLLNCCIRVRFCSRVYIFKTECGYSNYFNLKFKRSNYS